MRGEAMTRTLAWLAERGYDLSTMDALEMFAGDGRNQLHLYRNRCRSIEAWERDEVLAAVVLTEDDRCRVRCGDSLRFAKEPQYVCAFDLVIADIPRGGFTQPGFVDHVLRVIPPMVRPGGVVILTWMRTHEVQPAPMYRELGRIYDHHIEHRTPDPAAYLLTVCKEKP